MGLIKKPAIFHNDSNNNSCVFLKKSYINFLALILSSIYNLYKHDILYIIIFFKKKSIFF